MLDHEIKDKIGRLTRKRSHLEHKIAVVDDRLFELYEELEAGTSCKYQGSGLYIIKSSRFYKIGIASDIKMRMADLQVGNPFDLRMAIFALCDIRKALSLERELHKLLENKNHRGEWFKLDDFDLKTIINVLKMRNIGTVYQNLFDPSEIFRPSSAPTLDKRAAIIELIKLARPNGASTNMIIENMGIEPEESMKILNDLRRAGEIFEPKPGIVKVL